MYSVPKSVVSGQLQLNSGTWTWIQRNGVRWYALRQIDLQIVEEGHRLSRLQLLTANTPAIQRLKSLLSLAEQARRTRINTAVVGWKLHTCNATIDEIHLLKNQGVFGLPFGHGSHMAQAFWVLTRLEPCCCMRTLCFDS